MANKRAVYLDADDKPKKRFFRSRAHCNPLSHNDGFQYPKSPEEMNWQVHFPNIPEDQRIVRFLDIGMGFGGLTVALAELFPDKLVLGMEIRAKVCEYVRLRIDALRKEEEKFQNAACLRTNCMRYLPNFFRSGQIEKIFICFPDPHFKAKNHRRRIISHALLTEYAYFLAPGGRIYAITDVEDLHRWHVSKLSAHPMFRPLACSLPLPPPTSEGPSLPLPSPEYFPQSLSPDSDPALQAIISSTEEGMKVSRLGGKKYWAVFERINTSSSSSPSCSSSTSSSSSSEGCSPVEPPNALANLFL